MRTCRLAGVARLFPLWAFLLTAGCGICTSLTETAHQTPGGAALDVPARTATLFLRRFDVAVAREGGPYRNSWRRGAMEGPDSRFGVSPSAIVHSIENSQTFARVTTDIDSNRAAAYLLDGRIETFWETPWWSWAQAVDAWLHAWVLPTFGKRLVARAELRLYTRDGRFIRGWDAVREETLIGTFWWVLLVQTQAPQRPESDAGADILEAVIRDMRADLAR
jgi:hypothetical protein